MSADEAVAETPQPSRWYGWQTLAVDGAALTLFAIGIHNGAGDVFSTNRDAEAIALMGTGTYLVGPPVVHLAHRRPGVALASLGLRVVAPLAGLYTASALNGCVGSDYACGTAQGVGALIGIGTAIALDAALLARESREPERKPAETSASRPRLSPGIAVTRQSRALVLAGSF